MAPVRSCWVSAPPLGWALAPPVRVTVWGSLSFRSLPSATMEYAVLSLVKLAAVPLPDSPLVNIPRVCIVTPMGSVFSSVPSTVMTVPLRR